MVQMVQVRDMAAWGGNISGECGIGEWRERRTV